MKTENEIKTVCEFCGKEISVEKLGVHLKSHHMDRFDGVINLTKYLMVKRENIKYDDIDNIINDYYKTSVLDVDKKYGFRFRKYISGLGLKRLSVADVIKNNIVRDKMKITMLMRYGAENASNCEEFKQKKRNTFTKNYGVDNIWKLREYRLWWEDEMIKKYGKVCLADLYGKQNAWGWKEMADVTKTERIRILRKGFNNWYSSLTDEEKTQHIINKTTSLINHSQSNLEKRIERLLNNNNIKNKTQYWVSRVPYDFFIDNKILLEVQGTYWHCDPRKYKCDDIIKRDGENHLVSEIWEKDIMKKNIAIKYGYKIKYLWEDEINEMNNVELLNKIIELTNED